MKKVLKNREKQNPLKKAQYGKIVKCCRLGLIEPVKRRVPETRKLNEMGF
jgi:hypothetical protein